MSEMKEQIDNEDVSYGSINNVEELQNNLRTCAIPLNIYEIDISNYEEFLKERRKLMTLKVREYYNSL